MTKPLVRSLHVSMKSLNKEKKALIYEIEREYRSVMQAVIDHRWKTGDTSKFLKREEYPSTWLSARMIQTAGKQAIGIISGVTKKQNKRLYVLSKMKEGTKEHLRLKRKIETTKLSPPILGNFTPMALDSKIATISLEKNHTSFEIWVKLRCIGRKMKIDIPLKSSRYFKEWMSRGEMAKSIRLDETGITFSFEVSPSEKRISQTRSVGIDLGMRTGMTLSDGTEIDRCPMGHTYDSIVSKLSRKKKGSKAYHKAVNHQINHSNWMVNQIPFEELDNIRLENLKNVRRGKSTNRYLSHWKYRTTLNKIENRCAELNVSLQLVNPTFTSLRCSSCGWTSIRNRKGKVFTCKSCGMHKDADVNAAINISRSDLVPIGYEKRHEYDTKSGFFWLEAHGRESIVPSPIETRSSQCYKC